MGGAKQRLWRQALLAAQSIMPVPTFSFVPDVSTSGRAAPSVLKARFGDGYEQRTADGLNSNMSIWELRWQNVPTTTLQAIYDFLKARKGVEKFLWTPPTPESGSAKTYVCDTYDWVHNGGLVMGLTATFEERPQI